MMTTETHSIAGAADAACKASRTDRFGRRIMRRLAVAASSIAVCASLLAVGSSSASAATIGGDYYSTPGSCQTISSTPYGLSWQQQLEGVGTVTSYLNMTYPLPLDVARVTGTTKVVWRASLYYLSTSNTWIKVQTEAVHSVIGPWVTINSSWMGYLNWDNSGNYSEQETLSLQTGYQFRVAAETWWVNSRGASLAYTNSWLSGCNS